MAQNATTFANRFDSLLGLKLLLSQELSALQQHQTAALGQLEHLHHSCIAPGGPQQHFIEQAGQCGRCRAEMGVVGLVCRHCRCDELRGSPWQCEWCTLLLLLQPWAKDCTDEHAEANHTVVLDRNGRIPANHTAVKHTVYCCGASDSAVCPAAPPGSMSRCASGRHACSACTHEHWWREHRCGSSTTCISSVRNNGTCSL